MVLSNTSCRICGENAGFRPWGVKKSKFGDEYHLEFCNHCNVLCVQPPPPREELHQYYEKDYFLNRTERGYDNYYSEAVRQRIETTFAMNLADLDFAQFEATLGPNRRALDVGCAAGYFVAYLNKRNWQAEGIELSESAAAFGVQQLGLNIRVGDYLELDHDQQQYDLITLWASIEHMPNPALVFAKTAQLLRPGGLFILSTCRYGAVARHYGAQWRFLNVPEHLYYFRDENLVAMGEQVGLKKNRVFSYGSGFTAYKNMSIGYRVAKAVADKTVKLLNIGDMVVMSFKKE